MYSDKNILASKTIWLGILTAILSVFGFLAGEEWIQQYPRIVAAIGTAVGLLTIAVRFLTDKPLKARL